MRFRVWGLGLGFRTQGLRFRAESLGFKGLGLRVGNMLPWPESGRPSRNESYYSLFLGYIGVMEKKVETTIDFIRVLWWQWHHGSCYSLLGLYRGNGDILHIFVRLYKGNGKEHGSYYLGLSTTCTSPRPTFGGSLAFKIWDSHTTSFVFLPFTSYIAHVFPGHGDTLHARLTGHYSSYALPINVLDKSVLFLENLRRGMLQGNVSASESLPKAFLREPEAH